MQWRLIRKHLNDDQQSPTHRAPSHHHYISGQSIICQELSGSVHTVYIPLSLSYSTLHIVSSFLLPSQQLFKINGH